MSNKTDSDWPFRFIAQGLDVCLVKMVSKAVVKICPYFHTCWTTHVYNYASDCSLHMTLAVNKSLETSQVGRSGVVNKQNK